MYLIVSYQVVLEQALRKEPNVTGVGSDCKLGWYTCRQCEGAKYMCYGRGWFSTTYNSGGWTQCSSRLLKRIQDQSNLWLRRTVTHCFTAPGAITSFRRHISLTAEFARGKANRSFAHTGCGSRRVPLWTSDIEHLMIEGWTTEE